MNTPEVFSVNKSRNRQMYKSGMFLLWRKRTDGRGKEGLFCVSSACSNPECKNTHLDVTAWLVPDSLVRVERTETNLKFSFTAHASSTQILGPTKVQIDIITGDVKVRESSDKTDASNASSIQTQTLNWLARDINGASLDHLYEVWLNNKGFRSGGSGWKELDWDWWEPGTMVPAQNLLTGTRPDCYLVGDREYMAVDYYCVTPGCTCQQARMFFGEMEGERQISKIGSALIELPQERVIEWAVDAGPRELLEALWRAFQQRHRARRLLPVRQAKVQKIGHELYRLTGHDPQSDATKSSRNIPTTDSINKPSADSGNQPGRNERCPCGSGKKYKRCCGR